MFVHICCCAFGAQDSKISGKKLPGEDKASRRETHMQPRHVFILRHKASGATGEQGETIIFLSRCQPRQSFGQFGDRDRPPPLASRCTATRGPAAATGTPTAMTAGVYPRGRRKKNDAKRRGQAIESGVTAKATNITTREERGLVYAAVPLELIIRGQELYRGRL